MLCFADAKQAYNVSAVSMERLAFTGLINAAARIIDVCADVADMPEDVNRAGILGGSLV